MIPLRHTACALLAAAGLAALPNSAPAAETDIKLPPVLVWTAYDVGSTGYSQAVGFGSTLKNKLGTTLRVLPGKNDVSRLIPVREKKADYSLTGTSDVLYAQEAMYVFGSRSWGPQAITQVITSVSDATPSLGTTLDSGIRTLSDIRGKRVAWVRGAPSLQHSTRAVLAFAGLTWDDVVKVELPGYGATFNALVEGQVDVIHAYTNAAGYVKAASSSRGLRILPVPHADEAGWKRLQAVAPYTFKAIAKDGPNLPPEGQEMFASPYPILVTTAARSEDDVYNMTKAMVALHDAYKGSAPGMTGWAIERQRFAETMIPFHPGSVRYYKEISAWTPQAQATLEESQRRVAVVTGAWNSYLAKAPADDAAFADGWMKARAKALEGEKLITIQDSWETES